MKLRLTGATGLACSLALGAVLACAGPALGTVDVFEVNVDTDGNIVWSSGTGFNDGEWYHYEDTDWRRMWFYNGPYEPWGLLEYEYWVAVTRLDPELDGWIDVAFGCATPSSFMVLPEPTPPLPPLTAEEENARVFQFCCLGTRQLAKGHAVLMYNANPTFFEEYNQEWVSVDVRGCNVKLFNGSLSHSLIAPGDADRDHDVDDDDLSLLLASWGQETDWDHGEFSDFPPVNDDDLSLLLANWTGESAVPEPATLVLLAVGGPAALRTRRRPRRWNSV